ncbi:MAG TPA: FAD-dependent oxidoreductase, partial [Humisphaera sp.]|nr:FAD-dependent oxidoreductase [Humisphaera sp.]
MAISTEVLVCGAGCAGLTAALAAARNGAKVLLVERAGFAGGIITCVGLSFFDGIADYYTKKVVTPGIPLELFSKSGECAPDAKKLHSHNPEIHNVERFKHLADTLILAEGSKLKALYHSFICGVKMKGDRISAVRVANKDGLNDIEARVVIDCTGDGDLAAWSGAPLLKMPSLQPMTMHWRVGNVTIPPGGMTELHRLMKVECEAAHAAGELPFFYGPWAGTSFAPNELRFHCIRVPGDATNAEDLTRAEMQGRKDCWTMYE